MRAKVGASIIAAAALLSASATANASDKDACFAAAVAGQRLRAAGRLIEAQKELITCARPVCPEEVTHDCTAWLGEVDAAIPTVVFRANEPLVDLLDVRVFVDGVPAGTTSDGRPVAIDPGTHRVRFTRAGRPDVEQTVVIAAGDKNRPVVAQFAGPRREPRPAAPAKIPAATWGLGGAGVVALGVFGTFGAIGVGDFNRYGCSVGCAASEKTRVENELRVADVALAVAVVAIGAAVIVYVARPTARADALRVDGTIRF